MLKVSVPYGEEIIETISRAARDSGISNGVIVTLIGMVDSCAVSCMDKSDHKIDIITEYQQPLELCGLGEINAGVVHIHAVLGAQGNSSITGHLVRAHAGASPTNAYVIPQ